MEVSGAERTTFISGGCSATGAKIFVWRSSPEILGRSGTLLPARINFPAGRALGDGRSFSINEGSSYAGPHSSRMGHRAAKDLPSNRFITKPS